MTDSLAAAEAAVKANNPQLALIELTAAVKASPANPRLRIFLAQLLCVLGQWERAHTQLNVVADLDPATGPMREMVGHALRGELLRAEVFAGKRVPMVFGQPDEWLGLLIESMLQTGQLSSVSQASQARQESQDRQESQESQVSHASADALAARAFEAAPATRGRINGAPFEWIADADSRLGPVLEAMVNGRYYWIPFSRLTRVLIDAPTDLRDRVWLPAQLSFVNGAAAIAMLPCRYPGSQTSDDGEILMTSKTQWHPIGPQGAAERYTGWGQRVLVTDLGEHDILSLRQLELDPAEATTSTAESAESAALVPEAAPHHG